MNGLDHDGHAAATHGIHHVTCIAGDAQENLNFYVGVMGLRLVKRSVNQDSPDTYHLFYADAAGTPGTDLTFFPWPASGPGRPGVGMSVEVSFDVPADSLDWWRDRLERAGATPSPLETRFGDPGVPFVDPHGLRLTLVGSRAERPFVPWSDGPVPAAAQIRGLHSVRLWERDLGPTSELLTGPMGFRIVGEEGDWRRFESGPGGSGTLVDLRAMPRTAPGEWGTGAVHHVAWRVSGDAEQMAVRGALQRGGMRPTTQIDRFWFRSVYWREPGGSLFELATDGPGFDRDEAPEHLGETLILPPWLEPSRGAIESRLPALRVPSATDGYRPVSAPSVA